MTVAFLSAALLVASNVYLTAGRSGDDGEDLRPCLQLVS